MGILPKRRAGGKRKLRAFGLAIHRCLGMGPPGTAEAGRGAGLAVARRDWVGAEGASLLWLGECTSWSRRGSSGIRKTPWRWSDGRWKLPALEEAAADGAGQVDGRRVVGPTSGP